MIACHWTLFVGLVMLASQGNPAGALLDANKHRSFADNITTILYTNDNECSSVLGVSMAFSLIYPGCTGDAIDQVRDVLGYPTGSNMQLVWEEITERMLTSSRGQCVGGEWNGVCQSESPLLKIANSVWVDDGGTLKPAYESVLGSFVKQIDLDADDFPVIVNEWVKDQTNGLIESIVPVDRPLYPPWELIAINSIYLKASWKHPFQESKTNLDSFYGSSSRITETSKAHFMNGVFASLPYSHEVLPGYQVVQLPFGSSRMSMIFVLPMRDGVGSILSSELLPALDDLQPTRVALSIPKFKFESTYDDGLKAAIIQAGITSPFEGGSLCGLFEGDRNCESIFIGKVIQKTVIDVHEVGVEAAAVTAIMVGRSAPLLEDPVSMVCDHPFQFFVYDGAEDLVLFEGRLGAPAIPEIEPAAPLLDSAHSDGDFWSKAFYVNPINVYPNGISGSSLSRGYVSIKKCLSLIVGALLGFALGFIL